MRREIRAIDVLAAGKVGCLWGALLTAILGCIGIFLPMLTLPSLMAAMMPDQADAMATMGGGFVAALVAYLGAIFVEAVVVAIIAALGALLYNLIAKSAGGLVVEVEDQG